MEAEALSDYVRWKIGYSKKKVQIMITQKVISDILKPLIAAGVYKNEGCALKDIVAEYVQRKIDAYSCFILRMEQKYGKDFKAFSRDIKRRASVAKEDDWIEWNAAISMKEAWYKVFKELIRNAA